MFDFGHLRLEGAGVGEDVGDMVHDQLFKSKSKWLHHQNLLPHVPNQLWPCGILLVLCLFIEVSGGHLSRILSLFAVTIPSFQTETCSWNLRISHQLTNIVERSYRN